MLKFIIDRQRQHRAQHLNIINEYNNSISNTCKNNHIFGYSPHLDGGTCRYCFGTEPKKELDYFIAVLKKKY